jgi:hypothetical protein
LALRGKKWRETVEDCKRKSFKTCVSQNIRVIKSRSMRWAGTVARVGEIRNAYKILVGEHEGKDHSENLGVDGKIISECMLGGKGWNGRIWLR